MIKMFSAKLVAIIFTVFLPLTIINAQTPEILKDINQVPNGWQPSDAVFTNGNFFFVGEDVQAGSELWKSDGTAAGTVRVKDIAPGAVSSNIYSLVASGNVVFFMAFTEATGQELWRSDGTESGTQLVADLTPGSDSSNIFDLIAASPGLVAFTLTTPALGNELYTSDGTLGGTIVRTETLNPGPEGSNPSSIYSFTFSGSNILLYAATTPATGIEPYFTNLTANVTGILKDIEPGNTGSQPQNFFHVPSTNRIFFSASTAANGNEPWVTSGSSGSTVIVKDLTPGVNGSFPSLFASTADKVVFAATEDSGLTQIFRSDGTGAGTAAISTFSNADPVFIGGSVQLNPGLVLFQILNGEFGFEFWRTDGATVALVNDLNPGSGSAIESFNFKRIGTEVFFNGTNGVLGNELWKTDGTSMTLVADALPGEASSGIRPIAASGTRLLTIQSLPAPKLSLFSAAGSEVLSFSTILPGTQGSSPSFLANLSDGKTIFSANDPFIGRELYVSDGTTSGTSLLKDLRTGQAEGINFPFRGALTNSGNKFVFSARSLATGTDLFVTDGTASGTNLLKDINPGVSNSDPGSFLSMDTYALFSASEATTGRELWRTDGTLAGTTMIKDASPGATSGAGNASSNAARLGASDRALFQMRVPGSGLELGVTDGTDAGTVLLKDLRPGASSSTPQNFTTVGALVYFTATDGANGTELWKSDGTVDGTVMVFDIRPGSNSSSPRNLTAVGNLVFFTANDGTTGIEMWRSDGTAAGTIQLADLNAGAESTSFGSFSSIGNKFFFRASTSASGSEPYTSDGTPAGTIIIELAPGSSSSSPSPVSVVDGVGFFSAITSTAGRELYRTDGTVAGTTMVSDFVPGAEGTITSSDAPFLKSGTAYLAANVGNLGSEPAKYILDQCVGDFSKTAPGVCGCGASDQDVDADGTPDCIDQCSVSPIKIVPGVCGCGVSDQDLDADGTPDCFDQCSVSPIKTAPGVCGCNVADVDSDGDGFMNCVDQCSSSAIKTASGVCGCGVADTDVEANGIVDCLFTDEARLRTDIATSLIRALQYPKTDKKKKGFRKALSKARSAISVLRKYLSDQQSGISVAGGVSVLKQSNTINKAVRLLGKANTSSKFKLQKRTTLRSLAKLKSTYR